MKRELALDLVHQVLRTTNAFYRESRRLFRPHGLTDVQFNVLNVLADADGGLSQREISDILVVDRSNVTGLLDRLEQLGWTRRGETPGDRRAHCVVLTAAGRKLWAEVHPVYTAAVREIVGELGERRASATLQSLRALEGVVVARAAMERDEAPRGRALAKRAGRR